MKIVAIDNFDRDWIPEHVEEEGLDLVAAKRRCDELNAAAHPMGEWYYVVRGDEAKVRTLESMT